MWQNPDCLLKFDNNLHFNNNVFLQTIMICKSQKKILDYKKFKTKTNSDQLPDDIPSLE